MLKTNVMRILETCDIKYKTYDYSKLGLTNGEEIAKALNENPNHVFKTLVTIAKSHEYYVFMVRVSDELDLKKCAGVANEKNIEMIPQKELLPLTGYVHGGCSPIGMKKKFVTFIDQSILSEKTIIFSAGKVGYQVEIDVSDINKAIDAKFADISKN